MMKKLLLFSVLICGITACSSDDPVTPLPVTPEAVRGLYILNEGNFQRGNASLSFFVPDSAVMYNNVFQERNGRKLGDVAHSITMYKGLAYIVVNNSHRIEVVDPQTHNVVKTITCPPGSSPRSIAFDSSGLGYISNLYLNSISVYDDASNTIIDNIPVGPNPEGLLYADGFLYVANSGFGQGNTVSVINISNRSIFSTIHVGDYPTIVKHMRGGTIGVLCMGAYNDPNDPNDDTPASLILIQPSTRSKVDSIPLPGHPMTFVQDDEGHVYILERGVLRIHLATRTYTPAFIQGNFYSAFMDISEKRLYLTNPVDYVQPGKLEVYDYNGNRLAEYSTGIIPGAMMMTR
jgi:YVTN family beta-propeller protein